jgi:hypothetical protein
MSTAKSPSFELKDIVESANFAVDLIVDKVELRITLVTKQGLRAVVNKATRGEVQEHGDVYDPFQTGNGGGAADHLFDE